MKLVLLVLVQVFLQSSAVELLVGNQFVLLPCEFPTFDTRYEPTVEWSRYDLSPSTVHQRQPEGDVLKDQNQAYRGRTSMETDALQTGDLNLNLTNLQPSDSGNYTCTVRDFRGQLGRTDVQLLIGGVQQVEGEVVYRSVLLPCRTSVHLSEDVTVEWTDSKGRKLHVYQNSPGRPEEETRLYKDKTEINKDLLKTGDFSLTLKRPRLGDSDVYTCSVSSREGNFLMKTQVELTVSNKIPWILFAVNGVLLILLCRRWCLTKKRFLQTAYRVEYQAEMVEVTEGVDSVLLPFETRRPLPQNIKVEWKSRNKVVHVRQNSEDRPDMQDQDYQSRTAMKLKGRDFSLTLRDPHLTDGGIYICTVYKDKNILAQKAVCLNVSVCQSVMVEVREGVDSVLLPFKTSPHLLSDGVTVEWKRSDTRPMTVHVCHKDLNQPDTQDQMYKGLTEMNEDPLGTADLSLRLKDPCLEDEGVYTCTVYNTDGDILVQRVVLLRVNVYTEWVQVTEGENSVKLPFKTTARLPEDVRVEWSHADFRRVHVYQNGHNQSDLQDPGFQGRTEMEENPLSTGDLSLILEQPQQNDRGFYTCIVYGMDGNIRRQKVVLLNVKGNITTRLRRYLNMRRRNNPAADSETVQLRTEP